MTWDKYKDLNLMIKPKSECTCVDVAIDSYDNTIVLGYYPVMREYRKRRQESGHCADNGISVDRCLVDEIVSLWKANIMTFGCCCGHGDDEVSNIMVEHFDISKLIKMGYDIFSVEKGLVLLLEVNNE